MFNWKEEFTCYHEEIDLQHKNLFRLVSQLYDIIQLNDDCDHYDEIVAIFNELSNYTVYHFGFEEKMFEKYNYYPEDTKIQKLQHSSFVKKVSEIDFHELDQDQRNKSLEIVFFVARWIEEHILGVDKKFGEYYKSLKEK